MKQKTLILGLTLLTGIAFLLPVQAAEYRFGVSSQRSNITFQSETDFETILGSSNQLTGMAHADFTEGTAHVKLSVPVASLKTGIDLRDEHLASPMWLDAAQHPEISFESTSAKKAGKNRWKIRGNFSFHGVTREIETTVEVREVPAATAKKAGLEAGEWIRVSVPFQVKLSDFGVKIPDMAAAKVNDTWDVQIQAWATTGSDAMAAACGGCGDCGGDGCGGGCGGKKGGKSCG